MMASAPSLKGAQEKLLSILCSKLSFAGGCVFKANDEDDNRFLERIVEIGDLNLVNQVCEDKKSYFDDASEIHTGKNNLIFPVKVDGVTNVIVVLASGNNVDASEDHLEFLKTLNLMLNGYFKQLYTIEEIQKKEKNLQRLSKFPRENPNPFFCCDKSGKITYLNQAMNDFTKVNRLGNIVNIDQFFKDNGKSYSHICRSVGEDITSKNREFKIASRILLGSVSSYRGSDEAYVYLQDITELKTLAQEMTRKNQQLTDIKEELEFQTQRALDANRHKSEFLANMSHELRTPLNAVIGFSEVLLDELFGPLNDKQHEYLDDILESGRHLLSLINDILDLSKIEAGKMDLELEEFSVSELITMSMNLMREKAAKHNIGISVEIDESLDTIMGDQRKIKQVVFNLLANSLKFTSNNGQVGIRLVREGKFAKFCVWDSGIGISIEDQKHIFNEFRQADASLTKKYEGAGLGLAIVKKFVELHGGNVWVESKLNLGARFYFTIPIESPKWLKTNKSI